MWHTMSHLRLRACLQPEALWEYLPELLTVRRDVIKSGEMLRVENEKTER